MSSEYNKLFGSGLINSALPPPPPPPPAPIQNRLSDLMGKPEVVNLWYNKKHLTLDGYRFVGCRFDNCHLTVLTPHFELIGCYIDEATTILWGPQLMKVIQLFNLPFPWITEQMPVFAPQRNADGTITITG